MKIKMRTTMARADITVLAGGVVDLPVEEAKGLVSKGYADYVKEEIIEKAIAPSVPETAALRSNKPEITPTIAQDAKVDDATETKTPKRSKIKK